MNKKEKEAIEQEEYSRLINGNTMLLQLEGWIKYIEGFTKGLQTTDKINSDVVLDCIGEILEYMTKFRTQLMTLLTHCEAILESQEDTKLITGESDGQNL